MKLMELYVRATTLDREIEGLRKDLACFFSNNSLGYKTIKELRESKQKELKDLLDTDIDIIEKDDVLLFDEEYDEIIISPEAHQASMG